MPTIRGCAVSTSLLRQWAALLVTENAPFFISDALYEQLSADHHIWTRAEFATLGFSLSFVDSYRTYIILNYRRACCICSLNRKPSYAIKHQRSYPLLR